VDAYGDDLEDLSVIHYVRESWKTSNRMLSTQFPKAVVAEQEEEIQQNSTSLGYPWDLRRRGSQAALSTSTSAASMV
jgi:hypothetical protein